MRQAIMTAATSKSFGVSGVIMAVALGLFSHAAQADSPQLASMAACRADLATLCPGVEAGQGKKMRCLHDNSAKLSAACADALQARAASRDADGATAAAGQQSKPVQSAMPPTTPRPNLARLRDCRSDIAAFCSTVPAGQGRRIKCLLDNQAKVTSACASALSSINSQRNAAKAACRDDAQLFCKGERGPARLQCLLANKDKLTPACAAIAERRSARAARQL